MHKTLVFVTLILVTATILVALASTGTLNHKVHDTHASRTVYEPFTFVGLSQSIRYTNQTCAEYPGLRFNNQTAHLLENYTFVLEDDMSGNSSLPVNITQYVSVSTLGDFGVNISSLQAHLAEVPGIQLNLTDIIGVLFIEDVYNGVPDLEDIDPPPNGVFLFLECTGMVYIRIGEESDPLALVYFQYDMGYPNLYINPTGAFD